MKEMNCKYYIFKIYETNLKNPLSAKWILSEQLHPTVALMIMQNHG